MIQNVMIVYRFYTCEWVDFTFVKLKANTNCWRSFPAMHKVVRRSYSDLIRVYVRFSFSFWIFICLLLTLEWIRLGCHCYGWIRCSILILIATTKAPLLLKQTVLWTKNFFHFFWFFNLFHFLVHSFWLANKD